MFFVLARKRKRIPFKARLNAEGRRRRSRSICRAALLSPSKSPWQKLYKIKDDAALITVTGFDHRAFAEILSYFKPFFSLFTPWTKNNDGMAYKRLTRRKSAGGRRRMVNVAACLGLVLAWYRFRSPEYILQGWFGFTQAQLNVWLRFGRRMLLKALLMRAPDCLVKYPKGEEMEALMSVVEEKHDALKKVFCVADGLKLDFEACEDLDKQSMFYNGWTHGHYVTNLFVFGPNGMIFDAVLNVPGSVHDSTVASWGGVYKRLASVYSDCGGICVVDSAFASLHVPYLIKSGQDIHDAKDSNELRVNVQATSLRQAAEWGMRAIQSSMPRLKDKLKYELKGERRRILKLVPLLYNMRASRVGLNQIANTYVPNWTRDADFFINEDD